MAPHQAGVVSGLVNTSRQVGGAIGLAALATDRTTALVGAGQGGLVALTAGFTRAFLVAGVLAVLAAVAAFAVPPLTPRRPEPAAPEPARAAAGCRPARSAAGCSARAAPRSPGRGVTLVDMSGRQPFRTTSRS